MSTDLRHTAVAGGLSNHGQLGSLESLQVSVMILGYEGRKYLDDCLASVLDQEIEPGIYEVVFVDNGSSDDSAAYVREAFPSVRVVEFETNHGFSEGANRAVAYARGSYLAFLNQDTVVHRRWLRELLAAIQADSLTMACHSNMVAPWCPEYAAKERVAAVANAYVTDLSRFGFVEYVKVADSPGIVDTLTVGGASMLIDRRAIDELGYLFDSSFFSYCEDIDLGLRLNSLGYKVVLVPDSVVYHDQDVPGVGSTAGVRKVARIMANRLIAYYKNLHALEFLLFFPFLVLGIPLKARVFGLRPAKHLLVGMGLIPVSLWAYASAMVQFPRYAEKRRAILSSRRRGRWWLLSRLVFGMPWRRALPYN